MCGIQGSAFWEVLQGVGLALLSLPGKWDIRLWDVAAGSPAGRGVNRIPPGSESRCSAAAAGAEGV